MLNDGQASFEEHFFIGEPTSGMSVHINEKFVHRRGIYKDSLGATHVRRMSVACHVAACVCACTQRTHSCMAACTQSFGLVL